LLCRFALGDELIDAASFTTLRVASAATTLVLIVLYRRRRLPRREFADPVAALGLFAYAIAFSFAYLRLDTGMGALILFGAVQMSMFAVALRRGEHFPPLAWAGLAVAAGGLVWLVLPGLTAPDPVGAGLMAIAGIAWGVFSLRGQGVTHPVENIGVSFALGVPLALVASAVTLGDFHAAPAGIAAALVSGAVTSGMGYAVWYAALKGLTAARAATVQLSVPAIAAFGGVLLLGESLTLRLVVASAAMLGGVALVVAQRSQKA